MEKRMCSVTAGSLLSNLIGSAARRKGPWCLCVFPTHNYNETLHGSASSQEYLSPQFPAACLSFGCFALPQHTHFYDKKQAKKTSQTHCPDKADPHLTLSGRRGTRRRRKEEQGKGNKKKKSQELEKKQSSSRIVCLTTGWWKMILWAALVMSHWCLGLSGAAGLERIEGCGTRCSQVRLHPQIIHSHIVTELLNTEVLLLTPAANTTVRQLWLILLLLLLIPLWGSANSQTMK